MTSLLTAKRSIGNILAEVRPSNAGIDAVQLQPRQVGLSDEPGKSKIPVKFKRVSLCVVQKALGVVDSTTLVRRKACLLQTKRYKMATCLAITFNLVHSYSY